MIHLFPWYGGRWNALFPRLILVSENMSIIVFLWHNHCVWIPLLYVTVVNKLAESILIKQLSTWDKWYNQPLPYTRIAIFASGGKYYR